MIDLRPARNGDLDAIRALQCDAILAVGGDSYDATQVRAWARWQEADTPALLAQDGEVVVGVDDGRLLCMGSWRPDATDPTAAWIRSVFVAPRAARGGHGQRVMTELERRAGSAGRTTLHLFASFNARPFYENLGYRVLSVESWTADGVELGCLRMSKRTRTRQRELQVQQVLV